MHEHAEIFFRNKRELNQDQAAIIGTAAAGASPNEEGPWKNWCDPVCQELLYVPLLEIEGEPLGVLQLGGFPNMLMPEWWIRPEFRGEGLGRRVAYKFGYFVRAKGGTRMVRPHVVGQFAKTSHAMIEQFARGLNGSPYLCDQDGV